ncbi:MAG TPA: type III-B CRISPR-associated protein Cas10/Cmr2 [Ignavibacteria bacterium]|nr:type III-B CRISPR-associated protein Cas10/Cmr2 [Ignavibacteria bacterium]
MKYTALTIGPIHKTLKSVKSTKAIWAASYMFSFLMKEMIKKIKEQNEGIEFILPYTEEVEINGKTLKPLYENFQTGLFPDRFIIKGKVDDLQNIIDEVLEEFTKGVFDDINNIKKDEEKPIVIDKNLIKIYLENYINFYNLNIELSDKENAILEIFKLLDSLELQQRVIEDASKNYLIDFLEQKYPYNYFVRGEFTKRPFPSTIEISTAEFYERYKDIKPYKEAVKKLKEGNDENQIEFIKDIKNIVGDSFRNYQKYIAVVQADGDNIGTFIKSLYEQDNKEENIKRFSKNLLCFAIEAVKLIKSYNGTPIYAGGDDLLYFMPVAQTTLEGNQVIINKTVFSLISEIDQIFDKYFTNYNENGIDFKSIIEKAVKEDKDFKKPTLSYGISISYYKYPLNQALEQGAKQLFEQAKTGNKDAVSFTILKHSGNYFGTTFHKKSDSYTKFMELITTPFEKDEFIKSIIRKLDPQKAVLMAIGEKDKDERNNMIDNFFTNNFNESIHKDKNDNNKLVPFLENTKELVKEIYEEEKVNGTKEEKVKINENNIMKIYSALRFIEFIHNKEERDD